MSVQPPSVVIRRVARNCSKGLEDMLLDGVTNEPAIVDFFFPFCSRDCLTRNNNFIVIEQTTGHACI